MKGVGFGRRPYLFMQQRKSPGAHSHEAVQLWRGLMTLYHTELPRTGFGTRTQVTSSWHGRDVCIGGSGVD